MTVYFFDLIFKPIAIVLVDYLPSDFNGHIINQNVTNVLCPSTSVISSSSKCWQSNLKVDFVDQVTVTGNGARNLASEISCSIERLFNRFKGEVSVSSVNDLENVPVNINFTGLTQRSTYPTFR